MLSRLSRCLIVFVCLGIPVRPVDAASLRAIFWGAVAGNCAAQAADGISTSLAIGAGAHETNPLLVSNGRLDVSRTIAVKAALCALPVGIRYLARRSSERNGYAAGISMAVPGAVITQAVAFRNLSVWNTQKSIDASAASK